MCSGLILFCIIIICIHSLISLITRSEHYITNIIFFSLYLYIKTLHRLYLIIITRSECYITNIILFYLYIKHCISLISITGTGTLYHQYNILLSLYLYIKRLTIYLIIVFFMSLTFFIFLKHFLWSLAFY